MRGSAEPIRRSFSPTTAIDVESIDDPWALKALLKAREEKMNTLEKRIEIAQVMLRSETLSQYLNYFGRSHL